MDADMSWQYNQHDKHLQPPKCTHDMWAKLLEERGEAPPIIGGWLALQGRRPEPCFGSTASPLDTCKETHLGAILCVDLWRFKVGLIQGQGKGVTWIDDVALE